MQCLAVHPPRRNNLDAAKIHIFSICQERSSFFCFFSLSEERELAAFVRRRVRLLVEVRRPDAYVRQEGGVAHAVLRVYPVAPYRLVAARLVARLVHLVHDPDDRLHPLLGASVHPPSSVHFHLLSMRFFVLSNASLTSSSKPPTVPSSSTSFSIIVR